MRDIKDDLMDIYRDFYGTDSGDADTSGSDSGTSGSDSDTSGSDADTSGSDSGTSGSDSGTSGSDGGTSGAGSSGRRAAGRKTPDITSGSYPDYMADLSEFERSMNELNAGFGSRRSTDSKIRSGSGAEAEDGGTSAERRSDSPSDVNEPSKSPSDAGSTSDISVDIETELVTEDEYAVRQKKEADKKYGEPEKSGMEELNELIGLETVKHDVEEMVGLAKVRKMREDKGMKTVPVSLHLVFSGNPGTGKTTVARILAKLYKEIGILKTGQLVETDRSGLVAGYVGQTAIKTQKKIEEAMGGVLFIDEAYTLNQEGENYGQEAIDTILKAMEDHRDEFIVIVAGYTELMKAFVESNPGLKSRFNKFFEFPDYTADELQQIFMMRCSKYQYKLTEEAENAVREEIIRLEASKGENFANAREVRNLFERIITNQASRISAMEDVDEDTLTTITAEDVCEETAGTISADASGETPEDTTATETAGSVGETGPDALGAADTGDVCESVPDTETDAETAEE